MDVSDTHPDVCDANHAHQALSQQCDPAMLARGCRDYIPPMKEI